MHARSLLLCLTLGAVAATASASRPGLISFRRIAIPEDSPAHLTSALAQDRDGFLWIGTQGGLVRYDGYRFRTLTSGYVRTLLAARDGTIWIGTFSDGLAALDPKSGRVTRYTADRVEGLAEDARGRIWIAASEGLARLDHGRIEQITHEQTRGLLIDRRGNLWTGTRAGLQRNFRQVALAGEYVTKIYEDARGRIWIGTAEHGAAVLDPATGALRRFLPGELSHFWAYGFAETGDEVWIATFGGGIDVVDANSLQIIDRLKHDANVDSTLPAAGVGAILRDRSGVIWAGTWGDGIARHDPSTRAFRALRYSPAIADGLTHPSVVRAMEMRDGRIWAGTNGNRIDVFDRELHRVDHIGNLADGAVTCLAQAPNGDVWVATLDGTLQRMRDSRRFTTRDGLPGGPIRTIAFTNDGAVWAGSAFGMARIDAASRVTAYGEKGTAIEAIAVAPDGTLWVGTDHGLNHFDPATGRTQSIAGLPDRWVPDLAFDRKGRLWIGTHGGAVVLENGRLINVAQKIHRAPFPAEELIEDARGPAALRIAAGTPRRRPREDPAVDVRAAGRGHVRVAARPLAARRVRRARSQRAGAHRLSLRARRPRPRLDRRRRQSALAHVRVAARRQLHAARRGDEPRRRLEPARAAPSGLGPAAVLRDVVVPCRRRAPHRGAHLHRVPAARPASPRAQRGARARRRRAHRGAARRVTRRSRRPASPTRSPACATGAISSRPSAPTSPSPSARTARTSSSSSSTSITSRASTTRTATMPATPCWCRSGRFCARSSGRPTPSCAGAARSSSSSSASSTASTPASSPRSCARRSRRFALHCPTAARSSAPARSAWPRGRTRATIRGR